MLFVAMYDMRVHLYVSHHTVYVVIRHNAHDNITFLHMYPKFYSGFDKSNGFDQIQVIEKCKTFASFETENLIHNMNCFLVATSTVYFVAKRIVLRHPEENACEMTWHLITRSRDEVAILSDNIAGSRVADTGLVWWWS